MLRIMAVVFILYGMAQLFARSYRMNATAPTPGPFSVRTRIARLRAALPAYIIIAAGMFMLIASFVR
jgi:hypothetical protein